MYSDDIRDIALRRLHELEKQAAYGGPNTDPAVLIEIQELRTKYPNERRNGGTSQRTALQSEFDFLANTVAAGLVRLRSVEESQAAATTHRTELAYKVDMLVYAVDELGRWMKAGAAMTIVLLFLVVAIAIVVF